MITMLRRPCPSNPSRALFAPAPASPAAAVRPPGQRRLLVTAAVGVAIALASAGCGSSHPHSRAAAAAPRATATPARPTTAAAAAPAAQPRPGVWQLLPAAPVTTLPGNVVSVWTGTEMIIHGTLATAGSNSGGVTFAYRPATGTWTTLAPGPVPLNLDTPDLAAWTGSQMLVPGLTNGAYSPATGAWRPIPLGSGPETQSVAAWTGSQLLIWGGVCCATTSNSGMIYTPATNTWQQLPAAPIEPRRGGAMGAWTGTELVVAGGESGQEGQQPTLLSSAAAYNPATGTWRNLPPMPVPTAGATAVWDGTEVLFIAGNTAAQSPSAGGEAYNPATNTWRQLPAMPFTRADFAAVWTGTQVLVWGGVTGSSPASPVPPHGEAYDPATNQWTALPEAPLAGRAFPTAVWTGSQMIVWGGYTASVNETGVSYTDGAAYTPGTP
jgi:N-acetylneuraminic acid mutarotase